MLMTLNKRKTSESIKFWPPLCTYSNIIKVLAYNMGFCSKVTFIKYVIRDKSKEGKTGNRFCNTDVIVPNCQREFELSQFICLATLPHTTWKHLKKSFTFALIFVAMKKTDPINPITTYMYPKKNAYISIYFEAKICILVEEC